MPQKSQDDDWRHNLDASQRSDIKSTCVSVMLTHSTAEHWSLRERKHEKVASEVESQWICTRFRGKRKEEEENSDDSNHFLRYHSNI